MKYILVTLLALMSLNATATPNESGTIIHLQVFKNPDYTNGTHERFIVQLQGTITENNCGSDAWTGLLDSNAGRAQYSTILAAATSGKQIRLEGTSADKCVGGMMLIRNVYFIP